MQFELTTSWNQMEHISTFLVAFIASGITLFEGFGFVRILLPVFWGLLSDWLFDYFDQDQLKSLTNSF